MDVAEKQKIFGLEACELRVGWHGCLCYNKTKFKIDFKNHFIRCAILRILYETDANRPEKNLCGSLHKKGFCRREISKHKQLTYSDRLKFCQGKCKITSRKVGHSRIHISIIRMIYGR